MNQENSAKVSLYLGSIPWHVNSHNTARNRSLFTSIADYAWRIKYNRI